VDRSNNVNRWRETLFVLVLDIAATLALGGALILHAFSRNPLGLEPLFAHALMAVAFVVAVVAHNMLGPRPLYWSHFDFLVAVVFLYNFLTLYYSEARGPTATALTWVVDGGWAYLLGRYLFFRRLRLFNLMALALCFGLWFVAEVSISRASAAKEQDEVLLGALGVMQGLAWSVGVVLLFAQPFFLLRKPANVVFVIWSAALLFGISLWLVQQLIQTIDAYRLGHLQGLTFAHVVLLRTAQRLFFAYPVVGCGTGAWPWLANAFRPIGYVDLPPVVPSAVRMTCEWGAVGIFLFAAAWLRVPWFALRRWALFPNRRLRMSVLIFLSLMLLGFGRLFVADDFAQPWGWLLWWTICGTFVSLVSVRDPLRIFYQSIDLATAPDHMRVDQPSSLKAATGSSRPRPSTPKITFGQMLRVTAAAVVALAIFLVQLLPHRANWLAQRSSGETLSSVDYGRRLERAVMIFPYSAENWAKLAQHYQERASGDSLALVGLAPRIELAYQRAIQANPYEPNYYEQLAFFYQDTNAPTKVLDTLRAAVANNPNHFVTRLLLVRELERTQSYALATWHLRQALLRIAPQQSELFVRLAELYDLRGMRMDAIRACQYAAQGLPGGASALLRLKRLAERLGIAKVLL